MATAKTPKTPTAAKSALKASAANVAAAKPPEEDIVHSADIAAQAAATAATETRKATEKATADIAAAATEIPAPQAAAAPQAPQAAAFQAPAALAEQTRQAGGEMLSRGVGPLLDFSRENAILFVSTGNEIALGLHKLSLSLLDWSAESCDKGVAAGQAMLSARTVEEVMDLSRSMAKDGLQQLLKESSELSALSTKLLEETLVPLPVRFVAAVEKLASHAA